jgi:glycerol-3-phosphate acyltransferase PlsY
MLEGEMDDLLLYLGAYLIGSVPVDYLVLKCFKKIDLRKKGDGPIGMAQMWEITGMRLGFLLLALNVVKGGLAILLAHTLSPTDQPDWILAGFLTLAGDEFPVFLKFKGYRNVGVGLGIFGSLLFWMMSK